MTRKTGIIIHVTYPSQGGYARLSKSESACLMAPSSHAGRWLRKSPCVLGQEVSVFPQDFQINTSYDRLRSSSASRRASTSRRDIIAGNCANQRRLRGDGWGSGRSRQGLAPPPAACSPERGGRHADA